jgi:hypothetical protein
MLELAAERADGWSSWGGYDVETEEQMFARHARPECPVRRPVCAGGTRPDGDPPFALRLPAAHAWESAEYFRDMVGRYAGIGIDEFVLYCRGLAR